MKKFRPAATPLVTVDPFFSIWSCDDALYGGPTEHWTGRPCPIIAGMLVDNAFYSMSAFDENGKIVKARVYQTGLEITPSAPSILSKTSKLRYVLHLQRPFCLTALIFSHVPSATLNMRSHLKLKERYALCSA